MFALVALNCFITLSNPSWLAKYQQGLQDEESEHALRQQLMSTKNPKYILRNYFAQQTTE